MNDSASPLDSHGDLSRWDAPSREEASREERPREETPRDETPRDETPREEGMREGDPCEEGPRFGAVDIVEAFTAMRHEWRGQSKESRALAEWLQTAVSNLQGLEDKLVAAAAANAAPPDVTDESRRLVDLIVETDHHLARAIAALTQWEASRGSRVAAESQAIERYFAGMNAMARWFARPLFAFVAEQRQADEPAGANPAIEGLSLVLARLRRTMRDRRIERIDVQGIPFDATTMNAIGSVASDTCPSGHVAEQLSPAYRWRGELLRYADVRVAQ